MKSHGGPEKDAPEQPRPSAYSQKAKAQHGGGKPVPLTDPHMKAVFAKIGNVREKLSGVVVDRFSGENPAHVGPESAVPRGVRVPFLVSVLMMNAVSSHPSDRSAF